MVEEQVRREGDKNKKQKYKIVSSILCPVIDSAVPSSSILPFSSPNKHTVKLERSRDIASQKRSHRNTPELPLLSSLSVTTLNDDEENETLETEEKERDRKDAGNAKKDDNNFANSTKELRRTHSVRRLRVRTLEHHDQHLSPQQQHRRRRRPQEHQQQEEKHESESFYCDNGKINPTNKRKDDGTGNETEDKGNLIVADASATTERMKRNTDSMLEDAVIANKLKRRLVSRRYDDFEQQRRRAACKLTVSDTGLSDFVLKSLVSRDGKEGGKCLDAISAARPTDESLSKVADIACRAIMEGYLVVAGEEVGNVGLGNDNLKNKRRDMIDRARGIFVDSLLREEYRLDDIVCHRSDDITKNGNVNNVTKTLAHCGCGSTTNDNKLYVIEEGTVEFTVGQQVAGHATAGDVFGELSLVYGVPRIANVVAITPCVIVWTMDALSFRRVQALVANESLRAASVVSRSKQLKHFRKQFSSLTDMQELNYDIEWKPAPIELKQLKKISIIGKGTFGSVYLVSVKGSRIGLDGNKRGNNEKNGTRRRSTSPPHIQPYLGLKCMSKASIVERKNQQRVLIEKNALQSVHSPFIITLMGTFKDSKSIYFLTEFVQGGNLMSYMIRKDTLDHSECVFFAANIVSALVHVHACGFVHRDIKPENCLIDKNGYLKLCDFGMAKRLPSTVRLPNGSGSTEVVTLAFTMCGTPEFMAPEFVFSTGYNKGVDWWALGCILVEMYSGRSPFDFGDLKKTFKEVCLIGMGRKVLNVPAQMKKTGLETAEEFAQQLIAVSLNRLGSENSLEVKQHHYFDNINFKMLYSKQMTAPYVPNLSHASDISYFKKEANRIIDEDIIPYDGDDSWCEDF
mmetsp:Transcript_44975/g.67690  ORF Transcript_44975/g.67690 Transcript_44975/m.67690 type:complete len:856 (+) Transcript_44975:1752-4319(+)